MTGELNFEAMPFEEYEALASEQSGFGLEEEFGRRARSQSRRQGFAPPAGRVMPKWPGRPRVLRPKKPPVRPPRFPPFGSRWPWGVAVGPYGVEPEPHAVGPEPYGAAPEPYPAEPMPPGTEYMRLVQSALNDVLGLRLPLNGIADAATRSAVRSFQSREGLPVDGIVGPDTERALIAARGGKSPREGAPVPTGPAEPAPATPVQELGFEWETFEQEFGDTQKIAERAAVKSRVAAGQRDPNVLTDMVFFGRHPERKGRPLRADEHKLVYEWKAILRDIVLPVLARERAQPATGVNVSDREVGVTLAMAAKKLPELGITLEQLLVRHRAEAGGISIEVLLAFIRYEAGGQLNHNVTAGKWNEKYKKYIPSFYELGIFQTPAGDHGRANEAGVKKCRYGPPGHNVENSQFGQGWRRLTGTYPTENNWKDPTMQVRIGLWNLTSQAEIIRKKFAALFPSKQSEWYLRMAVLYSFARGAGATSAFLSKFKNELLALPEGKRWDFLRGKNAGRFVFDPENVDKKMALASKLRAVRGATVSQTPVGMP